MRPGPGPSTEWHVDDNGGGYGHRLRVIAAPAAQRHIFDQDRDPGPTGRRDPSDDDLGRGRSGDRSGLRPLCPRAKGKLVPPAACHPEGGVALSVDVKAVPASPQEIILASDLLRRKYAKEQHMLAIQRPEVLPATLQPVPREV